MVKQRATTSATTPSEPVGRARREGQSRPSTAQRLMTLVAAVGAALITWALVSAATSVEAVSADGAVDPVSATAVVSASAMAALAGWGVLAVLERTAGHRATTAWVVGAVLLLVASMVPVASPGDTAAGSRLALAALHLVVFVVVVLGLVRPLGRRLPVAA